jgi:hypothetical protein
MEFRVAEQTCKAKQRITQHHLREMLVQMEVVEHPQLMHPVAEMDSLLVLPQRVQHGQQVVLALAVMAVRMQRDLLLGLNHL